MRPAHFAVATAFACFIGGVSTVGAQSVQERGEPRKASYTISGRQVACDKVRVLFDRRLPSEGAAARGVLILNPRLLADQPEVVRLFVFHHECGHHHVGASELKADCWAVKRGVDDRWLDGKDLKAVCSSFQGAPETPTHPSARQRCRNIDQCFATAVAARDRQQSIAAAAKPASKEPRLVSGPNLISTGTVRFSSPAARD